MRVSALVTVASAGGAEPMVSVTAVTEAAAAAIPADSTAPLRVRRDRSRRRAAANPSSRSIPGGMSSVAAANRRRASVSVSFKVVLPEILAQRLQAAVGMGLDCSG